LNSLARARVIGLEGGAEDGAAGAGVGEGAAGVDVLVVSSSQGRGDDYIPVTLTSSNSGWHKGWFYLWNDPEHALPPYTECSIAKSQRNWADGPAKKE
jgi:hypothetical protein